MGIRFSCPNGHQLNVKAFLAGKRAKCPQCGAKVLVPRSSNGADEQGEYSRNRTTPSASPSSPPTFDGPFEPGNTERPTAPIAAPWFVRAPTGGQFGPVSDSEVVAWVREGRISPDTWVWREGWPDWQPAVEGLAHLKIINSAPSAPRREPPAEINVSGTIDIHAARAQQKKHQRTLLISGALGVAVVILFVILVWILSKAG